MRRITLWLLSTISALVLLLSYSTSLPSRAGSVQVLPAAGSSGGAAGPGQASGAAPRTLDGDPVQTPYGPVAVEITVAGGQITQVHMLQVPWGSGQDQQINGYAVPVLIEETTSADSAHIDMVSGATFTSRGYIESLQSALDQL